MASENARRLRHGQTDVEAFFWKHVRNGAFEGFKFRRQMPIGPFIVDFACPSRMLVVELDGGQHSENEEYDKRRTAFLSSAGYRVLRFWNHEVFKEWEAVRQAIWTALNDEGERG